jgi:lysyl-tRNA synthetase class 2
LSESEEAAPGSTPDVEEAEQRRRLGAIEALRARGVDPYPVRFERQRTAASLREEFASLGSGTETGVRTTVAGRLMLIRRQGKLAFATMRDGTGPIQLFVSEAEVGAAGLDDFERLDLGDWVGAEGEVMTTRRGELSIKVSSFTLLSKALRPLPDKWHGLSDVDTRFRRREVDLMVNEEARRVFHIRFAAVAAIRRFLDARGFLEVETPVLHPVAGGAAARPFVTHHNALDMPLYLRVAPAPDGGIYLIKAGQPIDEPAQMLLIKNDPKFNEQWPRALVGYKRVYDLTTRWLEQHGRAPDRGRRPRIKL